MKIAIATRAAAALEILQRAVALRPGHRLVWTASSIADVDVRCAGDAPDLLLIDLSLALADGGRVIERLANSHAAVVVVADSIRTRTAAVYDAMGLGALEAVDMPLPGEHFDQSAAPLVAKIDTVARLLGEGRGGPRVSPRGVAAHTLVAIGASAGGPAAVATVLAALPLDFPAAIVIVQHVDAEFVPGMAHWLSERSGRRVTVAADGDALTPGRVLLAGGSGHLVVRSGGRVGYTAEPTEAAYSPSVDVFFTSVRRLWRGEAIAVLLTGMGRDGAAGLKALRDQHVHTIAQDEESSAVYGMPKAAAALQAAVDILPLDRIASRLVEFTVRRAPALPGADRAWTRKRKTAGCV